MNKYKSDIADSAANMMQLPDTLEGMLQDIHGQKEVESPVTVSNESVPEPVPAATKKPQKQKQNKMNTTPDSTIPLIDGDELWASFFNPLWARRTAAQDCRERRQCKFLQGGQGHTRYFSQVSSVGGYSTQTLVNAILRSFILHYKKEFNKYKITEKSVL